MKLSIKKSKSFSRKGNTSYCNVMATLTFSNFVHSIMSFPSFRRKYKDCVLQDTPVIKVIGYNYRTGDGAYTILSIGKAVKLPEDINNEKIAYRIAESRARHQLYTYVAEMCKGVFMFTREQIYGELAVNTVPGSGNGGLYDDWLKYEHLAEREMQHIESLLSEL